MKKSLVLLVFLFGTSPFFAQAAFDVFEGRDEITAISVNKKMFDMMSKVKVDASDKETQIYLNLIRNLEYLKVFTTKNDRLENEMETASQKYAKSNGLVELLQINENRKNIKIMVNAGATNSEIKELVLFVVGDKNEESALMSMKGNFDLNALSVLTNKMRIPGSNELKKVVK